ncbi:MAG: type I 3-dehydroquinate dehydratase [Chitinispirillaceae bacterium]|nr:type I 3-dehydroquinate dehydratase [Chitinispirillaceae bacterium]
MASIGTLALGTQPHVAAVVDAIVPPADLVVLRNKGVELLEIRVDLFDKTIECITSYLVDIRAAVGLPMIGTVRENELTRGRRSVCFSSIMPHVDCIDIELGATDVPDIVPLARSQGKTILVSEHNFEKTPNGGDLQAILDRAVAEHADIVKIVTTAQSEDDAWRLLRFARGCSFPIVAFAMGEAGAFSRIKACEYGSLFTYGYITKAVAPGQYSAEELLQRVTKAV